MKKSGLLLTIVFSVLLCCSGCLGLHIGSGDKRSVQNATVGQQLIDLKTARDTGAITDQEYQAQKAKVLGGQ